MCRPKSVVKKEQRLFGCFEKGPLNEFLCVRTGHVVPVEWDRMRRLYKRVNLSSKYYSTLKWTWQEGKVFSVFVVPRTQILYQADARYVGQRGWKLNSTFGEQYIFLTICLACICKILEKMWVYNWTVHQLFIDFKKAYDSVQGKALYNILFEFGAPNLTLIKMYLSETSSKIRAGKNLSDTFPIHDGLDQGDLYCRCLSVLP